MIPEVWTLVITLVAAVTCAGLGRWLYLGRDSMVGDAVSHGVLPGLVVAFLLFGTRAPLPLLLFGGLAGWATTALSDRLRHQVKLESTAALGVAFTAMFALGLLLMHQFAGQVELDPGAVLYGQLEFASLQRIEVAGAWMPSVLFLQFGGLLLVLGLSAALGARLFGGALDPGFAAVTGIVRTSHRAWVMAIVAAVTVSVFEAVGVIVVLALFVAPSMVAHRFSRNARSMAVWTLASSVVIALLGSILAISFDVSTAGMIAVVAGMLAVLSVLGSKTISPS